MFHLQGSSQDDKRKKILADVEALVKQCDDFISDLGVNEDAFQSFMNQHEHFSEEQWKRLEKERETLKKMAKFANDAVKDPKSLAKAYEERANVRSHWLPVK